MFRWLASAAVLFLALQAAAPARAVDLTPAQTQAICGTRSTCKLTAIDAGQGRQQEKLTVVDARFGLADKPKDAPEDGCIGDPEAADGPDHDGGQEIWLIAGDAAPKRLLSLCNDGYGASGVGEDQIQVSPNMLTWDQNGGSAWRWDVSKQIRLSPLGVVKEMHCEFNDMISGTGHVTEVDPVHMRARSVGFSSAKKFGDDDGVGCPDWPTGPDQVLPTGPEMVGGYVVPMPGGNEANDGKGSAYPDGIALGDCALPLSSDGLHGFLIFGKPAAKADAAELRVVKETETSLLVQVYDPLAAAELAANKAKTWVGQPHIEVWTSETANPEDNDGANGALYRFHQVAIGLDDQVYAGTDPTDQLPTATHWAAKDEAGRDVTVYRVAWNSDQYPLSFGLGVAYSQAKGGKQARLVSSAQIKKNKPLYLAESWPFNADANGFPTGTCSIGADKVLKLDQPD